MVYFICARCALVMLHIQSLSILKSAHFRMSSWYLALDLMPGEHQAQAQMTPEPALPHLLPQTHGLPLKQWVHRQGGIPVVQNFKIKKDNYFCLCK